MTPDYTALDTSDLLPLRLSSNATTRSAALAEIRRRLVAIGRDHTRPATLAAAVGIPERTLRRVLDELDAVEPVAVGWTRTQGGGWAGARNALKERRSQKSTEGVSKK